MYKKLIRPLFHIRVMFDNFLSMLRKRRRLDSVPDATTPWPAERAANADEYWNTLFNTTNNTNVANATNRASVSTTACTAVPHLSTTKYSGAVDNDLSLLQLPSLELCSIDR
ncbi:uncharacterized protein LOC114803652 [Zeugodacus cucurbitae]|uniref:uncharacterized protein LOC114803652 n=1 Tax=Zeugodacus cucurbitae TaxID=28588 RepID=UPI0023D92991|nr:uncharacterized protein LOC114803652 [Zeugodacus cucurbitae]